MQDPICNQGKLFSSVVMSLCDTFFDGQVPVNVCHELVLLANRDQFAELLSRCRSWMRIYNISKEKKAEVTDFLIRHIHMYLNDESMGAFLHKDGDGMGDVVSSLVGCKNKDFGNVPLPDGVGVSNPKRLDWEQYLLRNANNKALFNRVKKCTSCGKPNAYTLQYCNDCGRDLSTLPVETTTNVFMAFILGVQNKISLRFESDQFICFDDMLRLGACHLNCIPTHYWIPDWRYLLRDPVAGLHIVRTLKATCLKVLNKQFLSQEKWRTAWFGKNITQIPEDAIAMGFNLPPSQYQLHLQFIVCPLRPIEYAKFLQGLHFTKDRFFPYHYVEAVLQKENRALGSLVGTDDTQALIQTIQTQTGIDYYRYWDEQQKACQRAQLKFARFKRTDFTHIHVSRATEKHIQECENDTHLDKLSYKTMTEQDDKKIMGSWQPERFYTHALDDPPPEFQR